MTGAAAEGGVLVAAGLHATMMTLPDVHLCHYITDGELERIGDVSDNLAMQVFLGSAGTLGGSLVSSFTAVRHVGDPQNLFSGADLVSICVTLVALGLAVFSGIEWRRHSKRRLPLITEIRGRPKVPVTLVSDRA